MAEAVTVQDINDWGTDLRALTEGLGWVFNHPRAEGDVQVDGAGVAGRCTEEELAEADRARRVGLSTAAESWFWHGFRLRRDALCVRAGARGRNVVRDQGTVPMLASESDLTKQITINRTRPHFAETLPDNYWRDVDQARSLTSGTSASKATTTTTMSRSATS
jgi:hypothetical protein